MMTNEELLERYNNLKGDDDYKFLKLKEIYSAIVENDYSNIMDEMAERFEISVYEWKVYRAISLRVLKGTLVIESLS